MGGTNDALKYLIFLERVEVRLHVLGETRLEEAHNLKYLFSKAQPYINYKEKKLVDERGISDTIRN